MRYEDTVTGVRRRGTVMWNVRLLAALSVAVALMLSGCAAVWLGGAAAAGAGTVVFYKGRLEQTLNAPLGQTHDATLKALRELGLPIREDKKDHLTGHLESEYADGKNVWIDLTAVGDDHTKVMIRVGIMGDEARALDILDRIRERVARSQL